MKRIPLNRRLVLEAATRAADGAGGYAEVWTTLGTHWGQVRPRTGRLANGEAGPLSVGAFTILVRGAPMGHSGRPEAGQRFRMGPRLFRIQAVTEEEPRGQYLRCQCQEEVAP